MRARVDQERRDGRSFRQFLTLLAARSRTRCGFYIWHAPEGNFRGAAGAGIGGFGSHLEGIGSVRPLPLDARAMSVTGGRTEQATWASDRKQTTYLN